MAKLAAGQTVLLAVPHSKVPATVLEVSAKNGMVAVLAGSKMWIVTASGTSGNWLCRANGTVLYGNSVAATHWFHRHAQLDAALGVES